jgi:hypothetical protein
MIHPKFPSWPVCRFLNWRVTAPLALGLIFPACRALPSHLHNAEDEKKILEAKTAIAAHNEAAPGLYTAMRSNLELFAKEENRVLNEYANMAASDSHVYDTLSVSNNEIDTLIGPSGNAGKIGGFINGTLYDQLKEMKGLSNESKAKMKTAGAAIATLKEEITKREKEIKAFNGSIALLRTALTELPNLKKGDTAPAAGAGQKDALNELGEKLKTLGDMEVTYLDAGGKEVKEKAVDVAKNAYPFFRTPGAKSVLPTHIPNAPGIDLVILSLALDLLQLDRNQAKADLEYLTAMERILEDAYTSALLTRVLAQDARPFVKANLARNELVVSNMLEKTTSRMKRNLDDNLAITGFHGKAADLLAAVRKVAVAKNNFSRSQALMKAGLGRLDHDRSIVQSSFNDARRRAVITRATEGLHAYHASGFKPEHAAQIIRIAQVVALGSIAEQL